MESTNRRRGAIRWLLAAVTLMGLWAAPAQAMNVTLTATPAGQDCQGASVRMAATVTNQPAGTTHVLYHFTVNVASTNAFEDGNSGGPWVDNPNHTWVVGNTAATRSPFNLWVVVNAFNAAHQMIGSAVASIMNYQITTCALKVDLVPKPPTGVKVHCQASFYAVPTPHTPPAGQHYEYTFYVQGGPAQATLAYPCAGQPPGVQLCNWRPPVIGSFFFGVTVYRKLGTTQLEVADTRIPYAVTPTGLCP